jgi:hypothetical protein
MKTSINKGIPIWLKGLRLLVLNLICLNSVAQDSNIQKLDSVSNEVTKIQAAYKNQQHLSFSVLYRYTNANNPAVVLDSAAGFFKLSGTRYWGVLDSMEFMQDSQYNVLLERESKLIRIAEPQEVYPAVINISVFDSAAKAGSEGKENYSIQMTTRGDERSITIQFKSSSVPYRECNIVYNSKTYLVKQLGYTINNSDDEYNNGEMVTVTAFFSNYSSAALEERDFSSSRYFIKKENSFVAMAPYEEFELFVASPNLLN